MKDIFGGGGAIGLLTSAFGGLSPPHSPPPPGTATGSNPRKSFQVKFGYEHVCLGREHNTLATPLTSVLDEPEKTSTPQFLLPYLI